MLPQISTSERHYKYTKSLAEMDIRKNTGATVFGFKDATQGIIFSPDPKTIFHNDDILILLGKENSIREFKKQYTRHLKLPDH